MEGTARRPYTHTPALNQSLTESTEETTSQCCPQCQPVLSRYSETFKGLVHQGSELKKRKHQNPNPKRSDRPAYRDLKR